MKKNVYGWTIFLVFLFCCRAEAQKAGTFVQVGYFAPFATQAGGIVGLSTEVKNWTSSKTGRNHYLHLLSHAGFFSQASVENHLVILPELEYARKKENQRIYPVASVGMGYLMTFQKQEGRLDLATGTLDYETETLHALLPVLNLGLRFRTKNKIGYYLKGYYGRELTFGEENTALIGLSLGVTLHFKPNIQIND